MKINISNKKELFKFFISPRLKFSIILKFILDGIQIISNNPDLLFVMKKKNNQEINIKFEDDKIKIYSLDFSIFYYKSAQKNIVHFINKEKGEPILNFLKVFQKEFKDEKILISPLNHPLNIFFKTNLEEVAHKFLPAVLEKNLLILELIKLPLRILRLIQGLIGYLIFKEAEN